jgi:hypothetical protein
MQRYIPTKIALLHTSTLALFVGGDSLWLSALLLLWIVALALAAVVSTALKRWPRGATGEPLTLAAVRAGLSEATPDQEQARLLVGRAGLSGAAFLAYAYLMREPFVALGIYYPLPALALCTAISGLATRYGLQDRQEATTAGTPQPVEEGDDVAQGVPKEVEAAE